MKTSTPEDPELARLIERDLDGDPEARQALDARLASDPDAALAFAQAHRMEALLAAHHARPMRSRLARFRRPLAWLAAAAALVLLAWIAFHPHTGDSPVASKTTTTNERPARRLLSPLRMSPTERALSADRGLTAAEIEAKASRFFIPEIAVNTASPAEAVEQIAHEFRRIASRHGDKSADSIQFETEGFEDTSARPVRLTGAAHLESLLAAVALQSGGLLRFGDGKVIIQRVRSPGAASESVTRKYNFPTNLLHLLTGEAPEPETKSNGNDDDPFAVPLSQQTLPGLRFENDTLEDAIELVRLQSQTLDPKGVGLNIVLKPPTDPSPGRGQGRITGDFGNISITDTLVKIADAAGLKAEEQEDAFVVASPDDPIFRPEIIEFSLPGLKALVADGGPFVAIEGNDALVEAAGTNFAAFGFRPTQILLTYKIVCANPSDLVDRTDAKGSIALSGGGQIISESQFAAFIRRAKDSKGSYVVSSPSVVTRASQRAKIEVIREIIYRVPKEDGSFGFEMIPAGWTLELDPAAIGEATHLSGTAEFVSLAEFPEAKDFEGISKGRITGPSNNAADPESLPIGDPTHRWSLDFEAELQNGQYALLDFMDLADGKKVYVLIKATLIDPSGQPLIPPREE